MPIDLTRVADTLREVAAARIIPRFQKLAAHEISSKTSPQDLVTVADIEAEADLARILGGYLPGSLALGEEAVSRGEASIETLMATDAPVWVIDPVDGTNNFAHGKPIFGTMVAMIQGGATRAAWIYDIPGNRMLMGERGGCVTLDGARLQLPAATERPLSDLKGFISTKFVPADMRAEVKRRVGQFALADAWMCCAHEYLSLCLGLRDFSFYSRIKPWDHLAGAMLFEEAGGYTRKWDGSLYRPGEEGGGVINARDESAWAGIRQALLS